MPNPPPRGQRRPPGRRSGALLALALLLILLILPLLAWLPVTRTLDLRITGAIAAYLILISLLTWVLFGRDKRKAQTGAWRTPESTLHLAELLGGWPAAFLAQRHFRHKIAKANYQAVFWAIVLVHQYAALDRVMGWRSTEKVVGWVQQLPRTDGLKGNR